MIQSNDRPDKSANSINKSRLVKGSKPLQRCRFYIDVKSESLYSKLENKIKELGGSVECFLVRELTHVVSDRPEESPSSRSLDESLSANESPAAARGVRQKTRADAMLEKVRRKESGAVRNPLQDVKLWNIPIWSVKKALCWLEKVRVSRKGQRDKGGGGTAIKEPYVKFESVERDRRPAYRRLQCWPGIDLEGSGRAAFKAPEPAAAPADEGRMTRKGRGRKRAQGGGYCEICQREYRELGEHLRSPDHKDLLRDDAGYLALDSLIKSANVGALLRLNGRRALRRRERASEEDRRRALRSRGPLWLDDGESENAAPAARAKRVSADERLVVDNKTYYKVEMMTNKLRSSAAPEPPPPAPDSAAGFVIKFKRVRRSELSVLNDEAESFMFPRRDDDDTDEAPRSTMSDREDDTRSEIASSSEEEVEIKRPRGRPPKRKRDDEEEERQRSKKRRTHADVFLDDNQRYYKFETPGSRLRYQGSVFPLPPPLRNNGDSCGAGNDERVNNKPHVDVTVETEFKLDDLRFSFETLPRSEPWYETFSRQDRGETYYTPRSDGPLRRPFYLPYQLAYIPPLDPAECRRAYERARDTLLGNSDSSSPSTTPATDDEQQQQEQQPRRRRRRRPRLPPPGGGSRPRKSPRQHASTLAILSSLVQPRRKRTVTTASSSVPSLAPSPAVLSDIPDVSECDVWLDELLSTPIDVEDEETATECGVSIRDEPDAVALLVGYDEERSKPRPEPSDAARSIRRKRKKNRTGWPKKKKLFPRPKREPVVEQEPVIKQEPVIEQKPVIEQEPVTEQSPVTPTSAPAPAPTVNVDLNTWENAEKLLTAKVEDAAKVSQLVLVPVVRVQKMDEGDVALSKGRLRPKKSSPPRTPRKLRAPRGKWYRER